jgi:hypothetical protein
MEGNCDVGRVLMASTPMKIMTRDITMEKTGLFMNILNIVFSFRAPRWMAARALFRWEF